ncbi:MAG TPA: glycogen debranching N-terminal domain-containing protein [Dongiaceae bacterium]|nr:glycogen debranching N-terminal domain-containing protein [Dongiaceae bacterium]
MTPLRGRRSLQGAPRVSPFYIPATAPSSVQGRRVLKEGGTFALLDEYGSAQATGPGPEGLFFEDTRYLSQLHLTIDDQRPLLLSSRMTQDNAMLAVDLANPDLREDGKLRLPGAMVHLQLGILLGEGAMFLSLDLRNYGGGPASFRLEFHLDADFVDIFELRGSTRSHRGIQLPVEWRPEGPRFAYRGLDGVLRRTSFAFDPPPDPAAAEQASWLIDVPAGAARQLALDVHCQRQGKNGNGKAVSTRGGSLAAIQRRILERRLPAAAVTTSSESFNLWLERSRADLDMLTTETPEGPYAYAGIPWFSTAFGRDGLIVAMECLWLDPALAAGTLRFLAARQAVDLDPAADAEPGKILHETRAGEMSVLREVPFARYYGSVDSTPLFIMLAARYHERTGDIELIRRLWPHLQAALGWMRRFGDADGDGFLEYDRKSVSGLINQGWKDSADSIMHADGSLAEAPIALAEVQAYAYAAYQGAAGLAAALGRPAEAAELEELARQLKRRFETAFWLEDLGTYALALDGAKRPCRVRSSNAGHVLFGGLAAYDRAARVADGLLTSQCFSGWGIRTLAEGEARYNPLSYHNGSVWPHDNALIAMGLGRYRLRPQLLRLLGGLFDTSQFMEIGRLPELFCGFARRSGMGPTAYPVACSPQAWASGAVFALLGALLGISFASQERQIRFIRPTLPPWLELLEITNLRLGDAAVDLQLRRSREDVGLTVLRRDGMVEVVVTS